MRRELSDGIESLYSSASSTRCSKDITQGAVPKLILLKLARRYLQQVEIIGSGRDVNRAVRRLQIFGSKPFGELTVISAVQNGEENTLTKRTLPRHIDVYRKLPRPAP
jgi:hypothetical protein